MPSAGANTNEIPGSQGVGPRDTAGPRDSKGSAVSDDVRDSMESVRSDVEDLIGRASEEARKLRDAAEEYGTSFANERKRGAADTVESIAGSLRDTGNRLHETPNLKALIDDAAAGLEDVAESIRSSSFRDLYRGAEEFARERPLTVAAGAAICGLLLGRFLKSSEPARRPAHDDADYRDDFDRWAR